MISLHRSEVLEYLSHHREEFNSETFRDYKVLIDTRPNDFIVLVAKTYKGKEFHRQYIVVPKTDKYESRILIHDLYYYGYSRKAQEYFAFGVNLTPIRNIDYVTQSTIYRDYNRFYAYLFLDKSVEINFPEQIELAWSRGIMNYNSFDFLLNNFSIRNISEIYDKLQNIGFHRYFYYIAPYIQDANATSLKKIFGNRNWKIISLLLSNGFFTQHEDPHRVAPYTFDYAIQALQLYNGANAKEIVHKAIKDELLYEKTHYCYELFEQLLEKFPRAYHDKMIEYYFTHPLHIWYSISDYIRMRDSISEYYDISKLPIVINNFEGEDLIQLYQKKHDFVVDIYNKHAEQVIIAQIKQQQDDYEKNVYSIAKSFEYETEDYIIQAPTELIELTREGKSLGHCVGSYTTSVSKGNEYILFLRKKSDITTSFFTIDVTSELRVRQIHGKCNCNLPEELTPLIQKWAAEKHLNIENTNGVLNALI